MLKRVIPLNGYNLSMRRLYVWTDSTGRLETSASTLTSVVQELMSKESGGHVIFDTDASVELLADAARLSPYQRKVLLVASQMPWETKLISMRSLLGYGYGVGSELSQRATLTSMYELSNGYGSSSGKSFPVILRELDHQLIGAPSETTQMISAIDRATLSMQTFISRMKWLPTMLNTKRARNGHAKNMHLTETLMELWATVVAISSYGFDQAVSSGRGAHLRIIPDTHSGWQVQNRPNRITFNIDSILVMPALGMVTMVVPSAPMVTDDDRVLLRVSFAGTREPLGPCGDYVLSEMVGDMPDIPRSEDIDYLLLPAPCLPKQISRSSKKAEPIQKVNVPPRIKVIQAANGTA